MVVSNAVSCISVGPVVLGGCAQLVLFGALCTTFHAFSTTPAWSDPSSCLAFKATIWTVFFLTTLATALNVHDIWYFSTLNTNDLAVLLNGTAPQTVEPLLTGLTSAIAQIALALRGARVLKSGVQRKAYSIITGILILFSFTASVIVTSWSIEYHFFYDESISSFMKLSFSSAFALWMWIDAASSCCITGVYLFVLWRQRLTAAEAAQPIISKIMRITLQSAGFPTLFAITSAIANQATTSQGDYNLISYAFWEPLTALYALSLFTTLTTGERITRAMGHREEINGLQDQWDQHCNLRKGSNATDGTMLSSPPQLSHWASPLSPRLVENVYDTRSYADTNTFCHAFRSACVNYAGARGMHHQLDCVLDQPGPSVHAFCGGLAKNADGTWTRGGHIEDINTAVVATMKGVATKSGPLTMAACLKFQKRHPTVVCIADP